MALYEKRDKMPPHLAEIPYGFKNLWVASVNQYNAGTGTFDASDVVSIMLNGSPVTVNQFIQLYDYNRDICGLSQPGLSGLIVFINSYDADTHIFKFTTLADLSIVVNGVLSITGDMVDNTNPQHPVVNHDSTKLGVTQYQTDQQVLENRLSDDETAIGTNADNIDVLQQNTVQSITFNGVSAPVIDNTADITASVVSDSDFRTGLDTKVDKSVAGEGGFIVKSASSSFSPNSRTITFNETNLSLEDGSTNDTTTSYALADILGITSLESIDRQASYFVSDSSVTSFNSNIAIALGSLFRYNADGSIYTPTTTDIVRLVFAVANDYSDFGTIRRTYISAIGRVMSSSASAVSVLFTNLSQYAIYNRYNSYRANQIVCDTEGHTMYLVLQAVPRPTSEAGVIALSNTLYFAPIKDDTIMGAGTIWANLETAGNIGMASSLSDVRIALLSADAGAGYNDYVTFSTDNIPEQILTDVDWDSNIDLWVTDGIQFTSRSALLAYLDGTGATGRYKISNNGIISTQYESGGITIKPEFSIGTQRPILDGVYQPILPAATSNNFSVYDNSGILLDSGYSSSSFATSQQGTKADSAVQSVSMSGGSENGTVQLVVDGLSSNIAVTGLGTAAYTDVGGYATSAQGILSDTALQPSDVVDNLTSLNAGVPLSANQGRILNQYIEALNVNGRQIGGFATFADAYTNTSQYPAPLQPISVGDSIYIDADENYTDQHTQYRVSVISGDGTITYAFVRILPDALRDFVTSPIQSNEIAPGAIESQHIQNNIIVDANIANATISAQKLSSAVQNSLNKADTAFGTLSITGTGNVISGASASNATITLVRGNVFDSVETSGTGNVVTGITASDRSLIVTTGTAVTSLPASSTSTPGIVQLNNTVTSESTSMALAAAQGKALNDRITANDTLYVKLAGNQTISGTKTLSNDFISPSKSALPTTPSATAYATEAQVATRVARPGQAVLNNIAVFDSSRNVVDGGVSVASLTPETISNNDIDVIWGGVFG